MFNSLFEEYLYLQEVSRWVNHIAQRSGKPQEEVERTWNETEKEMVSDLRKGGITDKLKQINKVVKQKMNVKDEEKDKE